MKTILEALRKINEESDLNREIRNSRDSVGMWLEDKLKDDIEYNLAVRLVSEEPSYNPDWSLEDYDEERYFERNCEKARAAYIDSLLDMLFAYAQTNENLDETLKEDNLTEDFNLSAREQKIVDEIADRFNISYSNGKSYIKGYGEVTTQTNTAVIERNMIARKLNCSKERADEIMINYLGFDKDELFESREPNRGDVENAPFVVDADGEKFGFDTEEDMENWINRNMNSFDTIEVVKGNI